MTSEMTRERLLEYLSSDDIKLTYKSSGSGAGLSNMLYLGYVYPYAALGKTAQNRIDDLAKALVKEIEDLDENTTPAVYYENTFYLFRERLDNEYILEQVRLMKSDRKKLASIVLGLQKVLDSDLLEQIQKYEELK